METINLSQKGGRELELIALTYPEKAAQFFINTPDDYTQADEFIGSVDALAKEITNSFDPSIQSANLLHKNLIAERNRHLAPLNQAKVLVKSRMLVFRTDQTMKRQAEEARMRELIRKAEEEAKLAEALRAEAEGRQDEADAIMEEKIYVPPIIVPSEVPKANSTRFRTVWRFRITDAAKIPREFLAPDMIKIGEVVRAMKEQTNIPGVESYVERI